MLERNDAEGRRRKIEGREEKSWRGRKLNGRGEGRDRRKGEKNIGEKGLTGKMLRCREGREKKRKRKEERKRMSM